MAMIATVSTGKRRVGMLSFSGSTGAGCHTRDMAQGRTVDPYSETAVIDSRGPRTNQAVVGTLSLLAFALDLKWLTAVVAAQLIIGLTAGRRWCLPCLLWFEVLQPRFGEGRIEDARPPR